MRKTLQLDHNDLATLYLSRIRESFRSYYFPKHQTRLTRMSRCRTDDVRTLYSPRRRRRCDAVTESRQRVGRLVACRARGKTISISNSWSACDMPITGRVDRAGWMAGRAVSAGLQVRDDQSSHSLCSSV